MRGKLSKTEQRFPPLENLRTRYAQRLRGEIAADWCVKNVGDICSIRTGKLDVNQADEDGAYPFFTCAERVYQINTAAFDTEAVLLAGNGDFNVKYYKGKFNAYQRTYVLSDLQVEGKYLYYYISYRLSDLTGDSRGSTIKYIRLGDIRDYPVPVAPLDQQKRIVAEIEKQFSRLDEAVANLKRVKANLKRYKAAVLKAAVEGRLVETEAERARREGRSYETGAQLLQRILETRRSQWQGKGKYKEPAAPDTTDLPKLPEGWVWATVEQMSSLVEYGSSAKTNEDSSGVPVLRMGNIVEGELRFDELKYLPAKHDEFPKLLLKPGDLLFNRTNSPELVGKTAVYADSPKECSFASYLIRVRPVDGAVPKLIAAYINSSHGRNWVKSVVTQQVGQANVNGTKLQALSVPLPPEDEQYRIVSEVHRCLSLLRVTEAQVDANLLRAERLRQAILGTAFSVGCGFVLSHPTTYLG